MIRTTWYATTVKSILTNEKYKGSAILQKKFTVDFLTKKTKVNEGEVPQYIVENSHPAIILPEEFELVQAEMLRRRDIGTSYSGSNPFSSKIVCGCCGGYFGAKVWHSTSKYRRTIWQCNHKFQNGEKCRTPHFSEETIILKYLEACKELIGDIENFIASCKQVADILSDCDNLDSKDDELLTQRQEVEYIISGLIAENASIAQDQNEFRRKCKPHDDRLNELNIALAALKQKKEKRLRRKEKLDIMVERLSSGQIITETFDGDSFNLLVDQIIAHENGTLTFRFMNDIKIVK